MLEYIVASELSCLVTAHWASYLTTIRKEELGYVSIKSKKK